MDRGTAPSAIRTAKLDMDQQQIQSDAADSPASANPVDACVRAADPALTEDLALALLKQADLSGDALESLSKNENVAKSRKVKIALASHPRTPRRISLQLIRESYTFDLMQFALTPVVAADLKRVADELLLARLTSISLGERISLARRASGAIAAALLLDKETSVWRPALENPRLTEAAVVRALLRPNAGAALVEACCHHAKWSVRPEVRISLLRNAKTPMARALDFARTFSPSQLRDILHHSNLPESVKVYLRKEMAPKARS